MVKNVCNDTDYSLKTGSNSKFFMHILPQYLF